MSKEGSPELTKSWVVVDSQEKADTEISGVQEVSEENHQDSDTDSISVISESGCSYKTDEDEFNVTEKEILEEKEIHEEKEEEEELPPADPVEAEAPPIPATPRPYENKAVEKWFYFATSAACAIILIGLSVALQQYFEAASDVNNFDPEQQFIYPHVQNIKKEEVLRENLPKLRPKRKNEVQLDNFQGKVAKLQKNADFQVKVESPIGADDLKIEENAKANFKLNKNKNTAAKCDKENCDDHDENFNRKIKQLKVKEDYLNQKEKFLIEKEHHLLKKEIKLNKKNQQNTKNKHDKKSQFKNERDYSDDSSDEESDERDSNIKCNKKNKKKCKEEKQSPPQKRFKFSEEGEKKRNLSGQWYMNMHEGRDSMRQRKRSNFKRNKAHWYFQWMVDRARLRVK